MNYTILILCSTFLLVMVAFILMPIKKMNAVAKALKSLLQVLPITKMVTAITKKNEIK